MEYVDVKKEVIITFYKSLKFNNFENITTERQKELDSLVEKWDYYFKNITIGIPTLMTCAAEKLSTSASRFGLNNGDESAYFYIKLIDPTLKFLEVHESANTEEEIKMLCMLNFKIYDKFLIYLEKCYNARFQEYSPDDLWTRNSIKR